MLRPLDTILSEAPSDRLIAAHQDTFALAGGGSAYRTTWHWHDGIMIMIPSQGALRFADEVHRSGTWLGPDRFVVVPRDAAHESTAAQAMNAHLALYLTPEWVAHQEERSGTFRCLNRMKQPHVFATTADMRATLPVDRARSSFNALDRDILAHQMAALILIFLARIERSTPVSAASAQDHGAAVVAQIQAHLEHEAGADIPLDALAEKFGMSRRHVTRLFREWTGRSIGDAQDALRVRRALGLLTTTDLPVGEIADRCGYGSGSALARALSRHLGASPLAIRKSMARKV